MEVLDFSHNKIDHIGRDALKNVSAKSVILSHNIIKSIKEYAFDGSRFISLYLNDNKQLSSISPLAFVNILEIKQLNLSNTEISVLPEQGLKNVKHIILRNVPNLKRLPSVLAFNNLNKAEFTYPYHCCFFKYVSREFAKGQSSQYDENYKEIQQRVCQRTEGDINFGRIRKKRNSAKTTTPFSSGFGWLDIDSWLDNKDMPVDGSDESDEEQAYTDLEVGQTEVISKFQECKSSAVDEFYMNISCSPQPDNLNPCEDIVGYTFLRPVIHVMWVMAIVGNIFVWGIIASVWTRRMRLHYFFMFNLAAGDFLTGCYLALLGIKDYSTRDEYYNYAVEWQTGWGCTIAGFISVFASQLSIMSMLIIAGEVYYNSKYGFYGKRMTPKLGYILMSIGYSYALLMATLPLFGVSSYQKTSVCLPLAITSGVDR
uniref:G-protein coupled receptors family 1 profile domain-containing protein n=1 Tax=Acrobeloides nanus TaxID=290746 RepID=A0A914EQ66_9BILA